MGRRLLLTVVAALLFAAPAAAQPRELWPGVTFDTAVQFTSNGPVALNVLIGPRPGGTTTLAPALSNETLTGLEPLTAIQRRVAGSATTAGVNGDYFNFNTGAPSGVLMREGQVASPPFGERSSAGITTDGTLDVRRVSFFGTWQGAGAKRTLNTFNEAPPANGTALYTQSWGPTTPALPGATALILFPLPAPVPNADLVAPVVEVRTGGGPVPIPLGGAVLVGVGSAAAVLATEGAGRPGDHVAPDLQAGVAGRRLRDRRRTADRSRRRGDLPRGRDVHTHSAQRSRSAHRRSASLRTAASSSLPSTAVSPGTRSG